MERRAERRVRVLKAGKLLVSEHVTLDCTVRDISPGGARIELDGPYGLPPELLLRVVAADLTIPAAVIWQRRYEAGIRFVGIGVVGPLEDARSRSAA